MQILCSWNNQPMSSEACLLHALKTGRPQCGYDYALLRSLFGSDEQEKRANEVHVSDLLGCPLKAYWDKREPSPEQPHKMLVRWMGSGFHAMVEGSDEHLDSELKLAYNGIVGRSDLVYKDGRLVDLKFTRWIYPDKLPYGKHVFQVNIYAYILKKMGRNIDRLQIQYIDASGPSKCRKCKVPVEYTEDQELRCPSCGQPIKGAHLGAFLIDVPMYEEDQIEHVISQRKENLEAALAMNMPPEAEPDFLCSYCSHAPRCEHAAVGSE